MTDGLRIVIVEDDALIGMDLADLLIAMGHDVRAIAATEAEAFDAAVRHDPDLMIVDGTLADGSGLSAMRQILARGFIPHLYVTGDPNKILQANADAIVVVKPFTMRGLANGIARARLTSGGPTPA